MEPVFVKAKVNKLMYDVPYPSNHLVNQAAVLALNKGSLDVSDAIKIFNLIRDICDSLLLDEGLLSK
jgi:hypothetical protein